jgi:hypothetical protein
VQPLIDKESKTAKTKISKLPKLLKRLWATILLGDEEHFISTCARITNEFGDRKLSESPLNKFGWTALHAACYYGRLKFVQYLIKNAKVSPNVKNINGWHSLIFAVMGSGTSSPSESTAYQCKAIGIIQYLLENSDVDPTMSDCSGNMALYYAKTVFPHGGTLLEILT